MTTKNQNLNLKERFNLFLKNNYVNSLEKLKEKQSNKLKISGTLKQYEAIANALVLWDFIIFENGRSSTKSFLEEVMLEGKNLENYYSRLIAMIYLLPVRVWRKILWRYNIDFVSKESFLRRLSQEQYDAIEQNYDVWVSGGIPPVLKLRFRDRVGIYFGKITRESLMEHDEEYTHESTKGAWAFNLLNLDFGFGLYPKGKEDDTKIINKSFTRFLSVKEHINDFTVNQEDGRYWQLYRSARSNYVFRPNKDIRLQKHVCPGFWATLIMHFVFWFISPIIFGGMIISIFNNGPSLSSIIVLLITSFPTVLWLFLATIKWLFLATFGDDGILFFIVDFFQKNPIGKILWQGTRIFFKVISVLVMLCFFFLLIFSVIYNWSIIVEIFLSFLILIGNSFNSWLAWAEKYLTWGPLVATLLPLTLLGTLWYIRRLKSMPRGYAITLLILIGMGASQVFEKYLDKIIVSYILKGIYFVSRFISDFFIESLVLVGSISIVIYFFKSVSVFNEDEREYAKRDRFNRFISIGWIIFLISVFLIKGNLRELAYTDNLLYFFVFFASFISGMLAILIYLFTIKVNTETIEIREEIRESVNDLTYVVDYDNKKKMEKILFSNILKNKWLSSLGHEIAYQKVRHLYEVITYRNANIFSFFSAIPIFTEKSENEILKNQDKLNKLDSYEYEKVIVLILKGNSYSNSIRIFKEREKQIKKQEELKAKRRKIRQAVWNVFLFTIRFLIVIPILFIWKWTLGLVIRFLAWVWQQILTLRNLWKLFNERCPYITESETIE